MNKNLKERIKAYINLTLDDDFGAYPKDLDEGKNLIEILNRKKGRQPGTKYPRKANPVQSSGISLLHGLRPADTTTYALNPPQLPSISSLEVD